MDSDPAHPAKKLRTSGPAVLTHARVLALAEDSPSIIRVRDLQVTLKGPKDAWGRIGKLQPALASVEVRMREPFGESSETDEVKGDTVHYGLLSKEVMRIMESNQTESLGSSVGIIWSKFTGRAGLTGMVRLPDPPFLTIKDVAYLRVSITMTKASLLGEGVTVSWAAAYDKQDDNGVPAAVASSLQIHGLRIPTLVGVNANERTARQIVLSNLQVEEMLDLHEDLHPELESIVVKEISESSFETLEALAQLVMKKLKEKHGELVAKERVQPGCGWLFGIELQKPIAVPFAEAACVELRGRTLGHSN